MTPAILISLADLEAVIERAVARALDAHAPREDEPQWLTTREVAELIGVQPRSVPQLVKRGLPVRKIGPKTSRFERAAVVAWIEGRRK